MKKVERNTDVFKFQSIYLNVWVHPSRVKFYTICNHHPKEEGWVVSTNMKFFESYWMSFSNWFNSLSHLSYFSCRPRVSNLFLWVSVWYSLWVTSHFFFKAAINSCFSSSFIKNFYLSSSASSSIYISLTSWYSSSISFLIVWRYFGTLP